MYGLAAHEEQDENSDRWLGIAAGITNTCHESYDRSDTKLGPEAFRFTDAVEARAVKQNERYYILRWFSIWLKKEWFEKDSLRLKNMRKSGRS